ncbi:hypothetical protein BAP_1327 [Bacillus sp. CN2]|nr:hypothetical protein BAP_1327 [Bacillus sp. CN2]
MMPITLSSSQAIPYAPFYLLNFLTTIRFYNRFLLKSTLFLKDSDS